MQWTGPTSTDTRDNAIPDEGFVVTTWHSDESIDEVLWFAKNLACHPVVELTRTIILDISTEERQSQLLQTFRGA